MSYRRDLRLDQIATRKRARCLGCHDIDATGLSYRDHTCGQAMCKAPRGADDAVIGGSQ